MRDRVCRDALAHYGIRSLQVNLQHDAGWPDRIFLTPFAPTWQEFKRPGDKPRPLQIQRLEILASLGYFTDVAAGWTDDYDTAMGRLQEAIKRKK